jgi:hypothetical protein
MDREHLFYLLKEKEVADTELEEVEKTVSIDSSNSTYKDEVDEVTILDPQPIVEIEKKKNEEENSLSEKTRYIKEDEKSLDSKTENNTNRNPIEKEDEKIIQTEAEIKTDSPQEQEGDTELTALDIEIYTQVIDAAYLPKAESIPNRKTETPKLIAKTTQTEPKSKKVTPSVNTEKLSFTEWLKLKSNPQQSDTIEKPSIEEEIPAPKTLKRSDIDALLNKFIKEEPSISRPVKSFYSPVENAKKSIQKSENLVSETLAKIYVIQKNYSQAIHAYEKLILLYPEKKTFFASQIEKINDLKNK